MKKCFFLGCEHLQPSRRDPGPDPPARDVRLLRVGQGRGPLGRRHGEVSQSPHLGRQHAEEPVAGYQ